MNIKLKREVGRLDGAVIYKRLFGRYLFSVEYPKYSLIARFGTMEECLQYARHMVTVEQQKIIDKLKGRADGA